MLQRHLTLRTFGLAAAFGAAALATACTAVTGPQPSALGPAGLPDYRAGQKFTFSDRHTRRVLAVESRAVRWSKLRDESYLMSPNFIVPILRRETSSRVVSHQVFGSPDGLWPLQVGKSVRFRVVQTTLLKKSNRQKRKAYSLWCEVPGTSRVTVPVGTFDTYRIECKRLTGSRQNPSRRITWYYAPELGHYVRRDQEYLGSGRTRTIELVSASGRKTAMAAAPSKPPKAAQVAPKPPAGRYAVHLASYRDAAGAEQGWSELKARFPALLAGKQPSLEHVDLGERGVFQRLLAVPFANRAEAEKLCSRLNARAAMQYCLVTMG